MHYKQESSNQIYPNIRISIGVLEILLKRLKLSPFQHFKPQAATGRFREIISRRRAPPKANDNSGWCFKHALNMVYFSSFWDDNETIYLKVD